MPKIASGVSPDPGSVPLGQGPRSCERRFQLLLNELVCAEAMVGLANIAKDFENFRRTYNNARAAYEFVVSELPQQQLIPEQLQEIHCRLSALHRWLDIVGPTFQSGEVDTESQHSQPTTNPVIDATVGRQDEQ